MNRITRGYEDRFRELLLRANARRVGQGTRWLLGKATRLTSRQVTLNEALETLYQHLASQPFFQRHPAPDPKAGFFCDSGLGGLARWLRAAGYDAAWEPRIDDTDLLHRVFGKGMVLLTTDSMLMERRLVRDRTVPAFWLPPTLKLEKQLQIVFREFRLRVREPRCMACGGELMSGEKQKLRERIPPKTFRWLDQYFICQRCGKLFWRGTHWERIRRELERVEGSRLNRRA